MITLAPFLKTRSGKEASPGEREAEALHRIVSVLLQGIALHGLNFEPDAFGMFEQSIRKLRTAFEQAPDEAEALLVACGAIRRLEQHNDAAEQHLKARRNEMEAVVALLSDTLLASSAIYRFPRMWRAWPPRERAWPPAWRTCAPKH
jgi:hypothetical protein